MGTGSWMWKCKECGKVCKQKNKLSLHIEIHLEGYLHKCSVCDKEYKTRNSLNGHIYFQHKDRGELNTEEEELRDIQESNFESEIYSMIDDQDKINSEKLDTKIGKRMERFIDSESGTMWKCTECGKTLKNKSKLKMHIETHLDASPANLKKPLAGKNIIDKSLKCEKKDERIKFIKAELVESREPFDSLIEDSTGANLSESFSIDDDLENNSFGQDQEAELKAEISKRIEQVICEEGKLWKCTECGKISKRKDNLGLHVETHLEGFSHTCIICDKTFKTKNSLQMHVSVSHRGNK